MMINTNILSQSIKIHKYTYTQDNYINNYINIRRITTSMEMHSLSIMNILHNYDQIEVGHMYDKAVHVSVVQVNNVLGS